MDLDLLCALLPALIGLLALAAIAWAEAPPFRRRTGTSTPVTPTDAAALSSKDQP